VQTENRKQQQCAGAIGHEQYHHFIYNNNSSELKAHCYASTTLLSHFWTSLF